MAGGPDAYFKLGVLWWQMWGEGQGWAPTSGGLLAGWEESEGAGGS